MVSGVRCVVCSVCTCVQVFSQLESRELHGTDSTLILAILVNYRKFEVGKYRANGLCVCVCVHVCDWPHSLLAGLIADTNSPGWP